MIFITIWQLNYNQKLNAFGKGDEELKKKLLATACVTFALIFTFTVIAVASNNRVPIEESVTNNYVHFAQFSESAEIMDQYEKDGMMVFYVKHTDVDITFNDLCDIVPGLHYVQSNNLPDFAMRDLSDDIVRLESPQYVDFSIATHEFWPIEALNSNCRPGQHIGPITTINQTSVVICVGPALTHPAFCPLLITTRWACASCGATGTEQVVTSGIIWCFGMW